MAIHKLMLKDVRCFAGENEFNLRPITFLVGENSTGKSTALGCLQALCNFLFLEVIGEADFNRDPFQMGAFGDIVRKTKPLSKTFELGMSMTNVDYNLLFAERKDGSEPVIQRLSMKFADGEIIMQIGKRANNFLDNYGSGRMCVTENGKNKFIVSLNEDAGFSQLLQEFMFLSVKADQEIRQASSDEKNFSRYLKEKIGIGYPSQPGFNPFGNETFQAYSFAPIRSEPKRTYDPVKETIGPEGGEIPILLMNLSMKKKKGWEQLKQQLEKFGKASGLFTDISIRKLRSSSGDPFQVQIKVKGPKANLMDVGYGVSQILPIVVRLFIAKNTRFLLQQPEVHLHPKGQAALASLLIEMRQKRGNSFIIETHSDYMIDRARIEIMKGNIKPEDVSLIYLEPVRSKVKVHNMTFDSEANITNPPRGYRKFFLREQDRLLGFGE